MPRRHGAQTAEVFPEFLPRPDTTWMNKAGSPSLARASNHRRAWTKRTDCLACKTLLAVARQRREFDPVRCQVVFEHLDTALAVQSALQSVLCNYRLTELQFATLVALFALDPEAATPADLAGYTGVSRAAMTEVLVRLENRQLVTRTRDTVDRRLHHLTLTADGRTAIDRTLVEYLKAVNGLAREIAPATQSNLLHAYAQLQQAAVQLSA